MFLYDCRQYGALVVTISNPLVKKDENKDEPEEKDENDSTSTAEKTDGEFFIFINYF